MISLDKVEKVVIISGEGEVGTSEIFDGQLTHRAIKSRLTRERCGGDRWARASVLIDGSWYDYITGEYATAPSDCDYN